MKVLRRSRSLRAQILTRTLVVGIVPLVILGAVAVAALWQLSAAAAARVDDARQLVTDETVTERLRVEADSTGSAIDLATTELVNQLDTWSNDPLLPTGLTSRSPDGAVSVLDNALGSQAEFFSLYITDRSGTVIAATGADPGTTEPAVAVWQQGWVDGLAIGSITFDTTLGGHVMPIAARIDGADGIPLGVLVGLLDTAYVRSIADLHATSGFDITVATPDSAVLADTGSDHRSTLIAVPVVDDSELPPGLKAASSTSTGTATTEQGLYGYSQLSFDFANSEDDGVEQQWAVVAGQSRQAAFASLAGLEDLTTQIDSVRDQLTLLVALVLLFAVFVAAAMAAVLARQIVGPVMQLTERARFVAEEGLPSALARLLTNGKGDNVNDTTIKADADNELGQLAQSFNSVQQSALRLAAGQAAQRRNALEMVANLAHRNQSLVNRQLRFIEDLEQSEEDPDRLDSLFRLDHLATRMRRGARSFLVLADRRGPIARSDPMRVEMVVQGALAEVEYYERVATDGINPMAVVGHVAADIAHLLAELIENALAFSPPDRSVGVHGAQTSDGYEVRIIDHGIGLTTQELGVANGLLASGVDVYEEPSKQLGIIVIARLAARHSLTVTLQPTDAVGHSGVTAVVNIPRRLVRPASAAVTVPTQTSDTTVDQSQPQRPGMMVHTTLEPKELLVASEGARLSQDGVPDVPAPIAPPNVPAPVVSPNVPAPVVSPNVPAPVASPNVPAPNEPVWMDDIEPPTLVPSAPRADGGPAEGAETRAGDSAEPLNDAPPSRYRGEISRQSASQISPVTQRQSRRTSSTAHRDRTRAPGDKRPLAGSASIEAVEAEADLVRNRWRSFQQGRRTADAAPAISRETNNDNNVTASGSSKPDRIQ